MKKTARGFIRSAFAEFLIGQLHPEAVILRGERIQQHQTLRHVRIHFHEFPGVQPALRVGEKRDALRMLHLLQKLPQPGNLRFPAWDFAAVLPGLRHGVR